MKKGFTLIELLVVVLIIGILAAVALPQYEVAVMKSKMSGVLPLMRAVKEANERFYLQNGYYTDDLRELDVQVPAGDVRINMEIVGQVCYSNGTCFDNLLITTDPSGYVIVGGLGSGISTADTCSFTLYYDHSTRPGQLLCGSERSNHPKCARVCKSMGY